MPSIISIKNLTKTYASGFQALKGVSLEIERGEIFALLGPNGAGQDDAHRNHLRASSTRRAGASSPTGMTS